VVVHVTRLTVFRERPLKFFGRKQKERWKRGRFAIKKDFGRILGPLGEEAVRFHHVT
jgi:hypothetical protein